MRKVEENSFGWSDAKQEFETSDISVRELARKLKVNEKTVRLRRDDEGWERNSAGIPQPVRIDEATAAVVAQLEIAAPDAGLPVPSEIARKTCGTIDALRAHLDTVVQNLHLMRELADAETGGDESPARARLVEKVLSLPGLVKAANDLTAAISRLADNGPGKKEEAAERAKATGTGRFATPEAPKPGATAH